MDYTFGLALVLLLLVLLPLHSYILYPLIIKTIAFLTPYRPTCSIATVPVSIIISAYNEEVSIRQRVENLLIQDYDSANMEILIGSDCSSDNTNAILRELEQKHPGIIRIFLFDSRRGKAAVVNDLVSQAHNDIVLFTDANTEFTTQSVQQLVSSFSDAETGGVSGRIVFYESKQARQAGVEEGKYFEYDSFIKQAEGECGILIGAFGGFFAIRKKLFRPIPLLHPVTDDLYISLAVLSSGYKLLYKPTAIAYEESAQNIEQEYRRKVRYSATNFQTLSFFKDLLFNRNIVLSYALWSHKVIRWGIPFLLTPIFALSILLFGYHPAIDIFVFLQAVFYGAAILGAILSLFKIRFLVFSLPYYFVITNAAVIVGLWRFIRGQHTIIWQPAR